MNGPQPQGRVYTLHPGDVACGDRDDRLETLLGSCVAIVLTDPRRTVGAMCHVVHASPAAGTITRPTAHGDAALFQLGAMLRAKGIEPRLCQAWVVGGGNMFPAHVRDAAHLGNVGAANAAWAVQALADAGIPLLGVAVGGHGYRRLRWTVGPGTPEIDTVSLDGSTISSTPGDTP